MSSHLSREEKQALLELLLEHQVLRFGDFQLKSHRRSPYFVDFGRLATAGGLMKLGKGFAQLIAKLPLASTKDLVVFGPAYKGIALAVATAAALDTQQRSVGWLFNRKEEKMHGEGGRWLGQWPTERTTIVMVDDVLTDGQAKREAIAMLKADFGATVHAVVVGFHRMEQSNNVDLLEQFQQEQGIPVHWLLNLDDLIHALEHPQQLSWQSSNPFPQHDLKKLRAYREQL